jgi:antitoxin component YwqK of YwqJK toxin-antitoxin module
MASFWYYRKNGTQYGPVASRELKAMAASGKLIPTDMISREDLSGWRTAGSAKGLFTPTTSRTKSSSPIPSSSVDADRGRGNQGGRKAQGTTVAPPSIPDGGQNQVGFWSHRRVIVVASVMVAIALLVIRNQTGGERKAALPKNLGEPAGKIANRVPVEFPSVPRRPLVPLALQKNVANQVPGQVPAVPPPPLDPQSGTIIKWSRNSDPKRDPGLTGMGKGFIDLTKKSAGTNTVAVFVTDGKPSDRRTAFPMFTEYYHSGKPNGKSKTAQAEGKPFVEGVFEDGHLISLKAWEIGGGLFLNEGEQDHFYRKPDCGIEVVDYKAGPGGEVLTGKERKESTQLPNLKQVVVESGFVGGDGGFVLHGPRTTTFFNRDRSKFGNFLYWNGLLHGPYSKWYPDGISMDRGTFQFGLLHGESEDWHPNGKRASQTFRYYGSTYGVQTYWHQNGAKKDEQGYLSDLPHGRARQWDDRGRLLLDCYFRLGERDGPFKQYYDYEYKQYYDNGQVFLGGQYEQGKPVGQWKIGYGHRHRENDHYELSWNAGGWYGGTKAEFLCSLDQITKTRGVWPLEHQAHVYVDRDKFLAYFGKADSERAMDSKWDTVWTYKCNDGRLLLEFASDSNPGSNGMNMRTYGTFD